MNIKTGLFLSLLTIASLKIDASALPGFTGKVTSGRVYEWVYEGADATDVATRAYYALHYTPPLFTSNPTQLKELQGLLPSPTWTPGTNPNPSGPTAAQEAAIQETKRQADMAQAEAAKAEDAATKSMAAATKAMALSEAATAQTHATAAQTAATKAQSEAGMTGGDATSLSLAANAQTAATAAQSAATGAQSAANARTGDVVPPTPVNPVDVEKVKKDRQALQLIQEIAAKVNSTPYSGNLKAALDGKAPVQVSTAKRTHVLGKLGKDNVKKGKAVKRAKKAAYRYA